VVVSSIMTRACCHEMSPAWSGQRQRQRRGQGVGFGQQGRGGPFADRQGTRDLGDQRHLLGASFLRRLPWRVQRRTNVDQFREDPDLLRRGTGLEPCNPHQPVQAKILLPAQRIRREQNLVLRLIRGPVITGTVITGTATGTPRACGRGSGTVSDCGGDRDGDGSDGCDGDLGGDRGGAHDPLQHLIRRRTFHTPIILPGTDN
jgi:hypothetical protein